MSQVMFSIIVPCYNVSDYIDECMESIINQTYQNYEVILIDDGSTDNTYNKCIEWGQKNSRTIVIKRKNGGLSAARNSGIEKAKGKYLIFVDGDDTIHSDSLSKIAAVIKNDTEVVITRLIKAYPDKQIVKGNGIENKVNRDVDKEEAIRWIMKESGSAWPAPQYVVSLDMINKYHLRFKEGYLHEDVDWTTKLACIAERYVFCDFPWYYHRMQRAGSITTVVKTKRIYDVIDIVDSFINGDNKAFIEQLHENEREKIVYRLVASVYSILSCYKYLATKEEKKCVANVINENKNIFRYTKRFSQKIFYYALNCIGADVALNTLAMLKR